MEQIKNNCENGVLTLYPEGNITSDNAADIESSINAAIEGKSFEKLVIDVDKIGYSSSAGLRIFLRIAKKYKDFEVINASSELYEIFDMTGFTEIMKISKAYRKLSTEGCDIIGKGAKGTVYRLDADTIIKVYHDPESLPDIQRERELAREAFILGIPTAIPYDVVRVGDSYGSVFELLNARSFSELIRDDEANFDKYVAEYARLLKLIHATKTRSYIMPDIKILINKWVAQCKDRLETEDYEKLKKLVDETPDTHTLLHGDFHTNNIMMQGDESLIIDMDTLSHGHPVFELASVHITYVGFGEVNPDNVMSFLGMPYEKALRVWEGFLPQYLDTTDADRINEVTEKVRLMSLVRLMRHYLRRGALDTAEGTAIIDYCRNEIHGLLCKVDSLNF